MLKIIPAILSNSKDEVCKLLSICEGQVDRVQIDVVDNQFAKNATIDPIVIADYKTKLFLDYHLMVCDPYSWVDKCVKANADRIIGQIEMMDNQMEFMDIVTSFNKKVGLAIDIETDIAEIDDLVLDDIDVVLVMSVKAGFGGQKFQEKALEKIEKLAEIRQDYNYAYLICVDGGINSDNIHKVYQAGADEVCIGRSLFNGEISENIENLKNVLTYESKK
ncbi:MAG: ribulose-phosphate 3-epimerase [Patescibacteria group bacterium]|nr:ribulose-phosphate 3-epimerase [Patescibacteria group bacterium]